jgi:ABC-type nickel/cobalt efflux system permease component RcnA
MLLPQLLLIGAVVAVGVLHTIVPDHWVPITLIARAQGWSARETALAALKAGTGHVVSTLLIGAIVWIAGAAFATRFGNIVSIVSSLALIGFGVWIGIGALRELRGGHVHGHGHSHNHGLEHAGESDGNVIVTPAGKISLSIFEHDTPPRFRVRGPEFGAIAAETIRPDGSRQLFPLTNLGPYWESAEVIPEPHQFDVSLSVTSAGRRETYATHFVEHEHHDAEHEHDNADASYEPLRGGVAVETHVHQHRHGATTTHSHRHDHDSATWHRIVDDVDTDPPIHEHGHKTSSRTALLLILGSSPMVEGIPAFFAAGKYGFSLIAIMSIAFAISTIATYVVLCVYSTAGLRRVNLGSFEKYGEVISGAFIALVGVVFLIFPVL